MADTQWQTVDADIGVLRGLAQELRDLADSPAMADRRRLWTVHNDLRSERPMILAESGGVMGEIDPLIEVQCRKEWARGVERGMRIALYQHDRVGDDSVVEPWHNVGWQIYRSDHGVQKTDHYADNDGHLGARSWDAPLANLQDGFSRLHPRTFSVDRDATLAWQAHLQDTFGDILPVRIRGSYGWTMGLTWNAIDLIGLQNLMLFMYDDPAGLHRLMAFLRDDQLAYLRWMEDEGLLTLNNENDYVGSGSLGYTRELPVAGATGGAVRRQDLWVLSESQETVGVGPDLFEEFIFPYQLSIAETFGLTYYGCCEPVHTRWEVIKRIPNLRKVSVSPWCDQEAMAADMQGDYVFARKPNPTLISTARFDEDALRADLRQTLAITREHGCPVELVMKDVHTLQNQPERLGRWVQIAREISAEAGAG